MFLLLPGPSSRIPTVGALLRVGGTKPDFAIAVAQDALSNRESVSADESNEALEEEYSHVDVDLSDEDYDQIAMKVTGKPLRRS